MEDYKAELERRRERGRLAQSAFRKRQAQAKQTMQEENEKLKRAIRSIAKELRVDDRSALKDVVREAAAVAGLDISDSALASINQVDNPESESSQDKPNATATNHGTSTFPRGDSASSFSSVDRFLTAQSARASGSPGRLNTLSIDHEVSMTIRRDPFQCSQCGDGPGSVLPFLGSGAFTFAGRIFWHLVERFEVGNYDPYSLQPPKPSVVTVQPDLQFRDLLNRSRAMRHVDVSEWMAMIQTRVRHYQQATEPQVTLAVVSSGGLEVPVAHELDLSGNSQLNWLSPMTAEQRIRAVVGDDVFAMLASPLLDHWEQHKKIGGERTKSYVIDGFLDILSESYVCFGDGPRWDVGTFDAILRKWCLSTIAGESH